MILSVRPFPLLFSSHRGLIIIMYLSQVSSSLLFSLSFKDRAHRLYKLTILYFFLSFFLSVYWILIHPLVVVLVYICNVISSTLDEPRESVSINNANQRFIKEKKSEKKSCKKENIGRRRSDCLFLSLSSLKDLCVCAVSLTTHFFSFSFSSSCWGCT